MPVSDHAVIIVRQRRPFGLAGRRQTEIVPPEAHTDSFWRRRRRTRLSRHSSVIVPLRCLCEALIHRAHGALGSTGLVLRS
jgi:hypothetical protein